MNTRALKLTTVFALALTAFGCSSPYLTAPEAITTVSNGENTWDISRSYHGSNTVYAAECFAKASAPTKDNLPALARTDSGHDVYTVKHKDQRLYMAACKAGEKVTTLNNVEWRNFGRGENRPFTQFTVMTNGQGGNLK